MKRELNLKETQIAIKDVKDFFEVQLANNLNLTRISAPLFIRPETGLNDNLTGVEKAVSFDIRKYGINVEIVQSLAKWKRNALKEYGFDMYEGIYADMDAIRPDEELDYLHSVYVDQWDWELIIKKSDRNLDYLKQIVNKIYRVFKECELYINNLYPGCFEEKLPEQISFISTQELEDRYPNLSPKEREDAIVREYKAVFLIGIGHKLKSGLVHDFRSPDYDDWNLNGDILFYNPITDSCIELSSMGIRVDEDALMEQLNISGKTDRLKLKYHKDLLAKNLPYTVGGGIGQSRICMFFLERKHIGEVQSSIWTDEIVAKCKEHNIKLL
ncbi:MAG: aspartate--ammonia ligase [Tissierellia bacterium]|nr:aspartate--ammonia ligase [Tissierellia bacterium]